MPNALYDKGRESFLKKQIDWSTDAIKAILVTNKGANAYGLQVSAATNATPINITTTAAHGLTTGDKVLINNVGGNTAANGAWVVIVVDTTHFTLNGSVGNGAWTSGGWVIKISLDQFRNAIPAAGIIATSPNIATQTTAQGVAGCADITFTAVGGAQEVDAVIFYLDTGSSATDRLICYIDNCTGLPVTPNGSNIVFQVDRGANKLFML